MKKTLFIISVLFITLFAGKVNAALRVVTAYPYIADITKTIGGDRVEVDSLATGDWDPHRILPRPSLIAKLRSARLLIINGAELEEAWIAPLIRESHNGKIQLGASGYLDLSTSVSLIQAPHAVSRALGDVHPSGNPHFHLDPRNIPLIARAICERLCGLDAGNARDYRKGLEEFSAFWSDKMEGWEKRMAPLRGTRVVQYHRLFDYFFSRYGIVCLTEIERLPGIPPSSRHIQKVIETVRGESASLILSSVYNPKKPALYVAEKTGTRMMVLPHDVGAVPAVTDVAGLFNEIVRRLSDD